MKLAIEIIKREIDQRLHANKHNHLRKEEMIKEIESLTKAVNFISSNAVLAVSLPLNKDIVGKYIILKDISCSDFMKDEKGKMNIYDTLETACETCGMYEIDDSIVVKVEYNHVERQ